MDNENDGLLDKIRARTATWTAPQKVAVIVAGTSAFLGSQGLMNDIFGAHWRQNDSITIAVLLASGAVFFLFGKKTPKE